MIKDPKGLADRLEGLATAAQAGQPVPGHQNLMRAPAPEAVLLAQAIKEIADALRE